MNQQTPNSSLTLRRQLTWRLGAMVLGVACMAGAGIWGVTALRQDATTALAANRQLRQVYEVGARITLAKAAREITGATGAIIERDLRAALAATQGAADGPGEAQPWMTESQPSVERLRALLVSALSELKTPSSPGQLDTALDRALAMVRDLSSESRLLIVDRQDAALHKQRLLVGVLGVFGTVIVLATVLIGWQLYHAVMRPLKAVAAAARAMSAGDFSARVRSQNEIEFAELARDFNHMADELQSLYRDMEQRVAVAGLELARSERLASVGYLAAGVAHEINNPLSIIAGYAERTQNALDNGKPDSAAQASRALGIIADEAFRCKEITQRLLELARPGTQSTQTASLHDVLTDLLNNIAAMPQASARTIHLLDQADKSPLRVRGSEAELKQVILNLLVNAIAATEPATGQIELSLAQEQPWATLCVRDNGCGLDEPSLSRVFEPFYTVGHRHRSGTGLGLSISHAIITGCGGRLMAQSDGLGRGSTFTIQLPLIEAQNKDAT